EEVVVAMEMRGFVLGCLTVVLLLHLSTAAWSEGHPRWCFNHVYNINVPSTSLCSVDLDSPGSADLKHKSAAPADMPSTEHMDHTLDGENQIVFTHRINIPKQACGCEHQLPDIKDILSRLEMLESELSSLREQCGSGAGCCGAPVTGTPCICDPGFEGEDCSILSCPDNCSNRGQCVNGECVCDIGYEGEDCSELSCPNSCQNRGRCVNGQCVCDKGFAGEDCSIKTCPKDCMGRGDCVDGKCVCFVGFTGKDCVSPPKDLNVVEVTPESVGLSWENEMRVTEYLITYVPTRPGGLELDMRVPGDQKLATIQELEPGIEYLISVYAILSNKRSVPVTARVATRELTSLGILNSLGRPETTFEQSGLGPGQEYEVKLSVVKNNMRGPPASTNVFTNLDAPTDLQTVELTDESITLEWRNSRAEVDNYRIKYGPLSGGETVPSAKYLCTILLKQIQSVTQKSKSFQLGSHYTDDVNEIPLSPDVDAPQHLTASNIQTENAMLTWRRPRADITGYILTYESSSGLTRVSPDPILSTPFNSDASTEYSVRLQALAGPKRSRVISTVFTTSESVLSAAPDCSQALLNGDTSSGLYTIYVSGDESQPLQVYCDMSTDGGGWIVFLRRQSGRLEFFRNWKNYTAGFGDMNDEFWLGLSNLHKITAGGQYELRVDLRDKGEAAYAQYDKFSVSEPRTRYKVHVGGYSGTAGDSMTYHHGRPFSTYDHDNDIAVTNCALSYKGAFWYKNCHRVNLMGRYGDNSHSKGVNWFHWKGHEHSIEFAEMKIRPSNFRNLEGRRKRKNTLKHRTAWWSSG
uniref:Tenascin C n=1 Tax=Salarias fasciatus TaxID=181472 RepID=A0A672GFQ3_SALFA